MLYLPLCAQDLPISTATIGEMVNSFISHDNKRCITANVHMILNVGSDNIALSCGSNSSHVIFWLQVII